MKNKSVAVSSAFKKMTTKAILSIVFFLIVYLLLILMAIGVTILAGYAGFKIIVAKPILITFMIGGGLACMGMLLLIFLFKFIFVKKTIDLSHLIEITKEQEPKLFELISEIVETVKTDFPNKVYLSSDVNASVFYASNFWSMFLPVKKNLQIGIGLVNSVSDIELKAILAHEFGHFSQRSMKVGSYVYNVNQIIFNMLYDNDSYDSLVQSWGNVNAYFSFFVSLAVKMVQGIQWVLKQVYEVVNLNYMSMSREMEFHADEVAAHVAGSSPLITSLLRLDLANHSYNTVLDYYGSKVSDAITTENIYPQQEFVMNFLAKKSNLPLENNLPVVSVDHLSRYNKSKLVITNKMASHPSTEDRVRELKRINIVKEVKDVKPASSLFSDCVALQAKFTEKLFSMVTYETSVVSGKTDKFIQEFTKEYQSNTFDEIFNSYYDNKNPTIIDVECQSVTSSKAELDLNTLFGSSKVDLVYTSIALESDINTLNQIASEDFKVKSFEYDGHKFYSKESGELIRKLQNDLDKIKIDIHDNDIKIYNYFLNKSIKNNKECEFKSLYKSLIEVDKAFDVKFESYIKMITESNFIYETTTFNIIEKNMSLLKKTEKDFKSHIEDMLQSKLYQSAITPEIKELFAKYLSEDWIYFSKQEYHNSSLELLSSSIRDYQLVLSKTFFNAKKAMLEFKVQLLN